jgi:hypothetical protein
MTLEDAIAPLLKDGWKVKNKTADRAELFKDVQPKGTWQPWYKTKKRVEVTLKDGVPFYDGSPELPKV